MDITNNHNMLVISHVHRYSSRYADKIYFFKYFLGNQFNQQWSVSIDLKYKMTTPL